MKSSTFLRSTLIKGDTPSMRGVSCKAGGIVAQKLAQKSLVPVLLTQQCAHSENIVMSGVQVRLLVDQGKADCFCRDRWGNTPLDEARRVGAAPVVKYLMASMGLEDNAGVFSNSGGGQEEHKLHA